VLPSHSTATQTARKDRDEDHESKHDPGDEVRNRDPGETADAAAEGPHRIHWPPRRRRFFTSRSQGALVCDRLHVKPTMPTADTEAAWSTLAAQFAGDPDVMFELFNEPSDGLSTPPPYQPLGSQYWIPWHDGAPAANGQPATVGYQDLATYLRGHYGVMLNRGVSGGPRCGLRESST
jgi:hypothetical protein